MKAEKSSPTVLKESIMLTCAIDSQQKWYIMSINVPNAFIQTELPPKAKGDRIHIFKSGYECAFKS